jgi:hypothetical protein
LESENIVEINTTNEKSCAGFGCITQLTGQSADIGEFNDTSVILRAGVPGITLAISSSAGLAGGFPGNKDIRASL